MVPHLALFISKEVRQGEELCFDYGDSDRKTRDGSMLAAKNDEAHEEDDGRKSMVKTHLKRTKCLCRSDLCTGSLPFDPDLL